MPVKNDPTFWPQRDFCCRRLALILAGCSAGNGEGLDAERSADSDRSAGATPTSRKSRTRSSRRSARNATSAPNAPQGSAARCGQQLRAAGQCRERRSAGPAARESRQSRPELPRAEDFRHGRGRWAHAANGQAPLPQDRIDLIRRWIAAGAPQAGAAPDNLIVGSSIPARGRGRCRRASNKLTVIFAGDVDPALAASGTFELRDGFDQPVPIVQARVPAGRPNVVELTLAQRTRRRQLSAHRARRWPGAARRQRRSRARRRRRRHARRRLPHVLRRQRRSVPMIRNEESGCAWSAVAALIACAERRCRPSRTSRRRWA